MPNRRAILSILVFGLSAFPALAAPPAAINLHGQLLSSSGAPVSGTRAYTVQFHDASTGGAPLGAALTGTVDVSAEGLFNLAVEPPAAIFAAPEVWYSLGVDTDDPADSVATDDVFPSRIQVYSVPFALQAGAVDASGVGDGTVDNTELDALDGVTGNVQAQIDAINTGAIAQNTSDIAANTAAIADKANSADVYTKTESDTNFVAVAGDAMTGALGVDTINEATTNAGVTAEGVTLQDSYIAFSPIAAPGVTTDKLYNVGGSLFFNGAAIGGTTINKDAINNSGTLSFDWLDAEVDNALSITGGTVNNDSFSALSDLGAESAIGTGAGQVAAGNHPHNLQDLSGAVTDTQVPDALTISGGTVSNNSFSALSDLGAESAVGTGVGQVAAGNHPHNLQDLSGAVTDAQVPNNITITEADTLDSVAARSGATDENLVLNGANQTITYNQAGGTFAINSDASTGLSLEGVSVLNGVITSATRVQAGDGTAGAPSLAFSGDTNTGIHRTASDTLGVTAGGSTRLTVDTAEVNLFGNILEVASGSAPGTTTNKLYNSSGNLFWNGTQLDTGGGGADTDTLQWTAGYVFGTTFTVYKHTLTKAGTITGFDLFGVFFSGASCTFDLKKNGTSIIGGPATVNDGVLSAPTVNTPSFSNGDVLELVINLGGNELSGASASITVEYP